MENRVKVLEHKAPAVHRIINKKLIFVINPISGTNKKTTFQAFIDTYCKERNCPFEILPTTKSGNYDLIRSKIQEEGFTDIIICGGDGTVNQVVNALRDLPVNFGVIPFGSGNGLANAAGIPSSPQEALKLIFSANAQPQWVDGFTINGTFACMLSGLGFDAAVAHDFSKKEHRGLLTYTQQSILNYFKAQPYQFEIVVDDVKFFSEAFFISIANSNQFGNNFKIAPSARLNDGLLDIVIVQKMNKVKLPFAILKQISGNNKLQTLLDDLSNKNVLYFQTPKLKIDNLRLAPMHIDGEPVDTDRMIDVEILPNAFKMYCPAGKD